MHNSLRVGRFWLHIKDYEDLALCSRCDSAIESLDHILLTCSSPERATIWGLAEQLWPHTHPAWPTVTRGLILSAGSLAPPATATAAQKANLRPKLRLLRIILTESAHFVWALRCERVISGRQHSPTEIKARWIDYLNSRLHIDCYRAKTPCRPHLPELVRLTWQPLLIGTTPHPPDNWVTKNEVLVGIRLPRPSADRGNTADA